MRGGCSLYMFLNRRHVETRALLHRRKLDESLGRLHYLLLHKREAPELVREPVVVGYHPLSLPLYIPVRS
jgi:hypothetical protein